MQRERHRFGPDIELRGPIRAKDTPVIARDMQRMSKCERRDGPSESTDQRLAPRYAMPLPVVFLLDNGGHLRALTRDVSAGGIFVRVDKSFPSNNNLRFLIMFPEEITTSCKLQALCDGLVVRRESAEGSEGVAIKIKRYQFFNEIS